MGAEKEKKSKESKWNFHVWVTIENSRFLVKRVEVTKPNYSDSTPSLFTGIKKFHE